MFHYLREKPRILVTGLMRSGTTICAEMISHDTGHEVFREEAVVGGVNRLPRDVVVQAPLYLQAALEFQAKGWHVVLMLRDFKDCAESTKRFMAELHPEVPVASMVDVLLEKQRFLRLLLDSDMRPMVVRYEDLRNHPLWVDDREGWKLRQTKSGPNYPMETGLS